uniref:Uncharacterized protein n=1 Tax=Manihot esculenta TaxID=3983 RepID=A0A251KV12_MANES
MMATDRFISPQTRWSFYRIWLDRESSSFENIPSSSASSIGNLREAIFICSLSGHGSLFRHGSICLRHYET